MAAQRIVLWCDTNPRVADASSIVSLTEAGLQVQCFADPDRLLADFVGRHDEVVAVISSMMESGGRKEEGKMNGFALFSFWRSECYRRGCRAPIFAMTSRSVNVDTAFAAGVDIVESDWVQLQNAIVCKLSQGRKVFWCDSNVKAGDAMQPWIAAGFEARAFNDVDDLCAAVLGEDSRSDVSAVITSMMESGGRKEAGKMNGFAALAHIRKGLKDSPCRPIFAIVSSKSRTIDCYAAGADIAICHDNDVMKARHGEDLWSSLAKAVLEVTEPPPLDVTEVKTSVCVDCGSGGIRVWQCQPGHFGPEFNRLRDIQSMPPCPIAKCCQTENGREMFAAFVRDVPKPCFVGATAGVRYAIEHGEVSPPQLEALKSLLEGLCTFRVLSGEDEGMYEFRSVQYELRSSEYKDAVSMISMGGRSMQLALNNDGSPSYFCLPFAAFTGAEVLRHSPGSWPERLQACAKMYGEKCIEERTQQVGLQSNCTGLVLGVVDTMHVARAAGITDQEMTAAEFLVHIREHIEQLQRGSPGHFINTARVLAMEAVVQHLLPDAMLLFRSDINVNWAIGYLLRSQESSLL